MRKQPQKLIAKIPHYESDSTVWKQKIYDAVREAQNLQASGIPIMSNWTFRFVSIFVVTDSRNSILITG